MTINQRTKVKIFLQEAGIEVLPDMIGPTENNGQIVACSIKIDKLKIDRNNAKTFKEESGWNKFAIWQVLDINANEIIIRGHTE